jgi:hypothetical protein
MNKWKRGHIGRFWNESFKELPYVRQPLTQAEIEDWTKQGYDHVKSFTGMMYDNSQPMPDWVYDFKNIFFEYENLTYTFYKMSTLEIMPAHVDHFNRYRELHSVERSDVVRILVMLENWKPGHYLEINGVGITNWIAGDWFVWESDVEHAASNIGTEDRYTLQITATRPNNKQLFTSLHVFNMPGVPLKEQSTNKYFTERFLPYADKGNPMYVYLLNSRLPELEKMKHDEETVNMLNEKGLDIYLLEPICSYDSTIESYGKNQKHSMGFYSEFMGTESNWVYRAEELDSIHYYIFSNKLTNVTVHTCDYNLNEYYFYYREHMKLVCDDWFVKTISPFNVLDKSLSTNFSKKFLNLNWRWTPHRHLIAAYLCTKSAHVSWYFRADFEIVASNKWFNAFHWDQETFNKLIMGVTHINTNAPLNVDFDVKEAVNLYNRDLLETHPESKVIHDYKQNFKGTEIEQFYRDVFCEVISETRFAQPTANFSEKVFQCMAYKKPFILAAPYQTLKYLRELGFKTFGDFWDESYDEEINNEQRLRKLLGVIEYIDSKSIEELQEMYKKMSEIVEHNYKLMNETVLPFI